MSYLVEGKFIRTWEEARPHSKILRFQSRVENTWIDAADFAPRRYILVCGEGDPWSHRAAVAHSLLQLELVVPIVYVEPDHGDLGWRLSTPICEFTLVYQLYQSTVANYTGRASIPLLWDTVTKKVVNNDSLSITKLLVSFAGNNTIQKKLLYTEYDQSLVDKLCEYIHEYVNNGVYRIGFSSTQSIYNKSIAAFYGALENLDKKLGETKFLLGKNISLPDILLLTTLVRYRDIYYPCLKCTMKRLEDFPNLWAYYLELSAIPEVSKTINLEKIKITYYTLEFLNPSFILPATYVSGQSATSRSKNFLLYSAPIASN